MRACTIPTSVYYYAVKETNLSSLATRVLVLVVVKASRNLNDAIGGGLLFAYSIYSSTTNKEYY